MKTSVNLAGVELKNPVMTASGTFGSGAEYSEFVDLKELGAVVTKGVANVPWILPFHHYRQKQNQPLPKRFPLPVLLQQQEPACPDGTIP